MITRQSMQELVPAGCLSAVLLVAMPATAQDTREAAATERRVARSNEVHPVAPGRIERTFLTLSDERVLDRLFNPRHGFFVRAGLPTEGAGFGFGPAWRASNPDRHYTFTASTAASVTGEWIAEMALQIPDLLPSRAHDRIFTDFSFSRSGRIANEFWGLGLSSADSDRTVFRIAQTAAGGTLGLRLMRWLSVGTSAAWLTPRIRASRSSVRTLPEVFDESTAPGLTQQPAFLRSEVSMDFDYRDSIPPTRTAARLDQLPLAGASRGGRYQFRLASHRDRDQDRYSFRQTTIDLQQHISLLHGHRVVSLRALAVLSDASNGHVVPFYLSPTLGGLNIGRGFPTFRFRDRNLLALQAEYRYQINPLVSGAVFVDAGQVAPRARGLAFSRFKTTYGTGLRLGAGGTAALRLDFAFGGERPTIILGMGHAF